MNITYLVDLLGSSLYLSRNLGCFSFFRSLQIASKAVHLKTRKGHVLTQRRVSPWQFYQHNYSCLNTAVYWLTTQLHNSPVQTSTHCFLTYNMGITPLSFITKVFSNYSTLDNKTHLFFFFFF